MKNKRFEMLRRKMKQYHRNQPWHGNSPRGDYIPHVYAPPYRALSYWSDAQFVLNRRRVWVFHVHPRTAYQDEIERQVFDQYWQALSDGQRDWWTNKIPTYKKLGRSRKKVVSYRLLPETDEAHQRLWQAFFAQQDAAERDGIDYTVRPSAHIEVSADSHMLNLVAPVEVLTMDDVYALVDLARRLMKRETTVRELWPDYVYGREHWLAERELRDRDHALAAQLHNHA